MTMKSLSVAAACFLLLLGCRNAEEKKMATIPAVPDHAPKPDTNQHPYYYGLIAEYRTMLAEDPDNVAAVIGLGNAYFDSGTWREAVRHYEHALKLEPRNADVRTDMGTAFRNMGMPDRALDEYRRALEYEPGHLDARYNMGIVYAFDFKDSAVATHIWEELLRLAPNHAKASYMRACIVTFARTKKEHP